MFNFLSLLSGLLTFYLFKDVYSCGIAPQYWCDSDAVARRCNVFEACKKRIENERIGRTAAAVHIDVYFESYCPDSINFINRQLYPTWMKLQSDEIMTFTLYPYGKATSTLQDNGTYAFDCQHGIRECEVNTIENCIILHSKGVADIYLPIIHCIEQGRHHLNSAETCVQQSDLSWNVIEQCWNGKQGNDLMYAAGEATHNLDPPMTWVPWIVVNGIHTDAIQQAATDDLMALVCSTYEGAKPSECQAEYTFRYKSQQPRNVLDKLKFKPSN